MEQQLTNRVVDRLATKQQDMKQRQIVNLAPSQLPTDAVNRSELDDVSSNINQTTDNINGTIKQILAGSGLFTISDITLTTASTTITAPQRGYLWIQILRQDAIGSRNIVWDTNIICASTILDGIPNTVSVFQFASTNPSGGGTWIMVGQPTTGMVL